MSTSWQCSVHKELPRFVEDKRLIRNRIENLWRLSMPFFYVHLHLYSDFLINFWASNPSSEGVYFTEVELLCLNLYFLDQPFNQIWVLSSNFFIQIRNMSFSPKSLHVEWHILCMATKCLIACSLFSLVVPERCIVPYYLFFICCNSLYICN